MTKRETATVLAALRYWQRCAVMPSITTPCEEGSIATDGGQFDSLDEDEIDALCEKINLGGRSHTRRHHPTACDCYRCTGKTPRD